MNTYIRCYYFINSTFHLKSYLSIFPCHWTYTFHVDYFIYSTFYLKSYLSIFPCYWTCSMSIILLIQRFILNTFFLNVWYLLLRFIILLVQPFILNHTFWFFDTFQALDTYISFYYFINSTFHLKSYLSIFSHHWTTIFNFIILLIQRFILNHTFRFFLNVGHIISFHYFINSMLNHSFQFFEYLLNIGHLYFILLFY